MSLPDRWDFGKISVKRLKNHQIGAFCFSQPWGINYMWLYLVYNNFFWVKVNFTFCTIGSSLSVDHEGTMHLERCYAKETAFCTRQFVFFWPSWCVEAREFFWLVYKKRNFEILRRTVLLFTKIRWGQKVSIFLRNKKMCHMMLNYMI